MEFVSLFVQLYSITFEPNNKIKQAFKITDYDMKKWGDDFKAAQNFFLHFDYIISNPTGV